MSAGFGTRELLGCYRRGVFPMADSHDNPDLFLVDPDRRGILPLQGFHIPRRLARTVKNSPLAVRVDTAFTRVMEACAVPYPGRESTWINPAILDLYTALHLEGHAHSVECWDGDRLVGGLYGVTLGGAFFGESMFSRRADASKIALVHLVARLLSGGYKLLDAQFHNAHLEQFGLIDIPRSEFKASLARAIATDSDFYSCGDAGSESLGPWAVHRITQIS